MTQNGWNSKLHHDLQHSHHLQLRVDLHTSLDCPRDRAEISVKPVHPFGCFAVLVRDFQVIRDKNALDDQDLAVQFNFTPGF
jgi:hypothetical protein